MTWLFDSNIHLSDSAYLPEIDFILTQMDSLKIKACCVSMNYENSLSTLSFDEIGTFDYFCELHPWMFAQVIVE